MLVLTLLFSFFNLIHTSICSSHNIFSLTPPYNILPPNPTLPYSTAIFDSLNRTNAYNTTSKLISDRILLPLNQLNNFITLNSNNTCTRQLLTIFSKWASARALTGQTNPYSCLLHRLTVYNAALEYIRLKQSNKQIVTWFTNIHTGILRWPVPYTNNFYIYEQRSLAAITFLSFQTVNNITTKLNSFLQNKFVNNLITTEIRGPKTLEYHTYYLNGLLDLLYILKYANGFKLSNWRQLDAVIKNLNNTQSYSLAANTTIIPLNNITYNTINNRWQCILNNKHCNTYTYLQSILQNRQKPRT